MQRLSLRAALVALALPLAAARADDLGGQKEFRDIFVSLLQQDNHLSAADARKLIYALPPELQTPPASAFPGGAAPLAGLDALFSKHRPSELYTLGAKVPVTTVAWASQFTKGPVLLIVVPGVFGEFIAHSPFEEVFANQQSAFSKEWLAEYAKTPADNKTDPVYSLQDLGSKEHPLTDIFDVASIDDEKGRPLVKAVFLKPAFASLETLGSIEENTQTYLRRLTKLFKVIGEQSFYLVGYSRGATVALELAVESHTKAHWGSHLKGVVSLGGVVYGTPLADSAFSPTDPTHELVTVLTDLAGKLHDLPADLPGKPGVKDEAHLAHLVEEDWVAWGRTAVKVAELERKMPKADPGIALEKIQQSAPGVRTTFKMVKEFAWDQFHVLHAPHVLHIEKSDHWRNVARFKKVISSVLGGVQVLTTQARLDWWRKHTLPPNLTYYAIGATMADLARPERANKPLFDAHGVCALSHDPISTFVDSIDFHTLRGNYYQLSAAGHGMEINDSQVPLHRVRFWPTVSKQLNPQNANMKAYFLGVLGQDHWGMSFPVAFDQHNKKRNPFPRATLMKAIGTFIARHP